MLPSDPDCYKRLTICDIQFNVSDDLARVLCQSPCLTYLNLYVRQLSTLFLGNARQLCECYICTDNGEDEEVQRLLNKSGIYGFAFEFNPIFLHTESIIISYL